MLPADQCLHSSYFQRVDGNPRLVMKEKLMILNCPAKASLQNETSRSYGMHISCVKLIIVTSRLLCAVKRCSRILEQTLTINTVQREKRNSYAGCSKEFLALHFKRR